MMITRNDPPPIPAATVRAMIDGFSDMGAAAAAAGLSTVAMQRAYDVGKLTPMQAKKIFQRAPIGPGALAILDGMREQNRRVTIGQIRMLLYLASQGGAVLRVDLIQNLSTSNRHPDGDPNSTSGASDYNALFELGAIEELGLGEARNDTGAPTAWVYVSEQGWAALMNREHEL